MNQIFQFFLRYARPYVGHYAFGFLFLFATNYVVVRIPVLIGQALNELQIGGAIQLQNSQSLALEIVVLGGILIGVRTLSRILFFNPGREIEYQLSLDLFGHLLTLQRPFYMRRRVGELVSLATSDTQSVRLLVGFAGLQICNVAVALPMHLYQMWNTDVLLTIACLVPVGLGATYLRWSVSRFYGLIKTIQTQIARLTERVLESYSGIATIRSHVADEAAIARFEVRNREYLNLQLRVSTIRSFSLPALGYSGFLATGVVLLIGGRRVVDGSLQVGHLATFTALLLSLIGILTSLVWVLVAISRGGVSLGRINELFDQKADLPQNPIVLRLDHSPKIEFRNLNYTYPGSDQPVLKNIDVNIEPGHTLGIFGKTGAGKTTLLDLLSRIIAPPPDSIFINGIDLRQASLTSLRKAMAVVPQDPFLFSTTLRDNIVMSTEKGPEISASHFSISNVATLETSSNKLQDEGETMAPWLDEIIEMAALKPDLALLPKNLDTVVGERGVMLSGGQRQRTALARALAHRPHLLLLDDILSAVDQGTESKLVQTISQLHQVSGERKKPTTIIVSHRTSVLEHANEIIVLDEGKICERGTHRQLVQQGGRYATAYLHQQQKPGNRS